MEQTCEAIPEPAEEAELRATERGQLEYVMQCAGTQDLASRSTVWSITDAAKLSKEEQKCNLVVGNLLPPLEWPFSIWKSVDGFSGQDMRRRNEVGT